MTTYNKYPRGSEWRKWDLHVHAPSKYTCAKMDEYFGSNPSEKFIRFIEELKELNDLAAVGITDYFSLDGYKEVVNYQNSLSHIPLILPNVELRLIPMTNDAKKINVHMIFNPENITVDEFERFLYKFEFGVNEKYTCKEEDLIRLGKSLDSHLSEEAAFKRGLNEFYISFNDFHEKYNAQSNRFKENTIVIVSNNSRDGVSGIQNMSATRNNIYMIADMIFSGNPSDRVYFLGLGIDSESAVKDKCGALKPCIHGSDYHGGNNGRKLAVPDLNKYCWIKADPTFEGLRQVIYEPKDRICIQELEPDTKRPYQVIESIRFIDSNFMTEEIPLNSNLTAIIGGKSTGKSVLLRNIAKAIDNKLVEDKLTEVNIPQYKQTVIDFSVKWKNGEESTVQTNIPSKKVIYIPQSYLNRLSGDIEKRETVIKLIEDIIKQNSQISAVFDKIEQSRREISKEVALEIESMYSCYQDIQEQEYAIKELGDADTVQTELNKLEQEITEYKKKEGMTDQEIADYQELLDENVALTDQKQVIETDMQNLDMLIQDGICFADIDIFSFSDKTGQKIQVEFEAVKQEAAKAFTIRLTALKTILEKEQAAVSSKLSANERVFRPLHDKAIASEALSEKINIAVNEREKIKKIVTEETKLKVLREKYGASIDKLVKKLFSYKMILEDNKPKVEEQTTIKDDLSFFVEIVFRKEIILSGLEDILNMNSLKTYRKNNPFKIYEQTIPDDYFVSVTSASTFEKEIKLIIENIMSGTIELKQNRTTKDAITALIKNCFYFDYKISQGNDDDIINMSEGKRAFVLLRLLIELDSQGEWPILLDQPEDDLDNRSIYNDLVKFIKEKKKQRQMIIVTHNPNLVVGADAEEVIIANQNGDGVKNTNSVMFEYVSGALENTFEDDAPSSFLYKKGVREHVCEVLEGGKEAFEKREQKYHIQ